MKSRYRSILFCFLCCTGASCGAGVALQGSSGALPPAQTPYDKILALSLGHDPHKRRLSEDAICDGLHKAGLHADASLDIFGPEFASLHDSAIMQKMILKAGYKAVLTIRVLRIVEQPRWPSLQPPQSFYQALYQQSLLGDAGYANATSPPVDVRVYLESSFYDVATGKKLWNGWSVAYDRNPTRHMAAQYAANVIKDLTKYKFLVNVNSD